MHSLRKISVVLASSSPRRHEMLHALGIDFHSFAPHLPEEWHPRDSARRVTLELAIRKVREYRQRNALVIGMDSLVVIHGKKLGKPVDASEARVMLQQLSDRTHQVISGVALQWKGRLISGVETTNVRFRRVHPKEIDWYIESGEPLDKAGAYAIQGLGRIFINRINGCYYNVVGFPLSLFQRLLKRIGLSILDLQRS